MRNLLGTVLFCLALAAGGIAAGPASRPSAPELRERQLAILFLGLTDANATVRARSRLELLGLKRGDLPELRRGIEPLAPLDAEPAAILRDIVMHVWLSEADYPKDPMGFLGITMGRLADADNPQGEVIVESRMPGFCAYRSLMDGDAILDIEEHPLSKPVAQEAFAEAIRECRPGEIVHLRVLRQGRVLRVPVKLDARPADRAANPWQYGDDVQIMLSRRWSQADRYWQETFGPMTRLAEGNAQP